MKPTTQTELAEMPHLRPTETALLQPLSRVGSDDNRILSLIERAAADPNVDVVKMKDLYALLQAEMARQSERLANEAMRRVQIQLPAIVKLGLNPSTNSKFAKLDDIQEIVTPIAIEHGLTMSFGTDHSPLQDHYGVTCTLSYSDDKYSHSRVYRCDVPCDNLGPKGLPNKTRTHGFGSALSYGERYLIKLMFNIRLVGEDDDGNQGRARKAKPVERDQELRTMAQELWTLLKPVRGADANWQNANQWLWREDILDAAAEQAAPDLTAEQFRTVISKVKDKLHVS